MLSQMSGIIILLCELKYKSRLSFFKEIHLSYKIMLITFVRETQFSYFA